MWISFVLFFSLLACLYYKIDHPNSFVYFSLFILSILPIATNIYGNYEFFPKDFVVVSKVHLDNETITIDKRVIDLISIEKLELEVNDWFGKKIVRNVHAYGSGPKLSRGVNNFIRINLKNSEQIALIIQLESYNQFIELGNWLKSLYKTKIEIMEKYDHVRSYGLKHLNYKEIQNFKKEYVR